jgi:hypothetical protein
MENKNKDIIEYGELFNSIIKFNRLKNIVEIGVAFGNTTLELTKAAKETGGFVWGYDGFSTTGHGLKNQYGNALENQKELVEEKLKENNLDNFKITKINTYDASFSETVKKDTNGVIDFAFIDGCHSYLGISSDFSVCYPLLSPTGIIAFHDTQTIDGCREFILDLRTKYFDGTYDIIDFPWGYGERRVGVSLLVKRTYPILNIPVSELSNIENRFRYIIEKEKLWYYAETQFRNPHPVVPVKY